jgi:hypothetical protein
MTTIYEPTQIADPYPVIISIYKDLLALLPRVKKLKETKPVFMEAVLLFKDGVEFYLEGEWLESQWSLYRAGLKIRYLFKFVALIV